MKKKNAVPIVRHVILDRSPAGSKYTCSPNDICVGWSGYSFAALLVPRTVVYVCGNIAGPAAAASSVATRLGAADTLLCSLQAPP